MCGGLRLRSKGNIQAFGVDSPVPILPALFLLIHGFCFAAEKAAFITKLDAGKGSRTFVVSLGCFLFGVVV